MPQIFSAAELNHLSAEVDRQLQALRDRPTAIKGAAAAEPELLCNLPQGQAIAQITQESPPNFLQKFGRAAKADLCEETGLLYKQWQKWGDLENQEALERLGAVLVAMGFSGGALESLAVAVVVIVVHIGIKAFCEDYAS
jgi:hypothetical protein